MQQRQQNLGPAISRWIFISRETGIPGTTSTFPGKFPGNFVKSKYTVKRWCFGIKERFLTFLTHKHCCQWGTIVKMLIKKAQKAKNFAILTT